MSRFAEDDSDSPRFRDGEPDDRDEPDECECCGAPTYRWSETAGQYLCLYCWRHVERERLDANREAAE